MWTQKEKQRFLDYIKNLRTISDMCNRITNIVSCTPFSFIGIEIIPCPHNSNTLPVYIIHFDNEDMGIRLQYYNGYDNQDYNIVHQYMTNLNKNTNSQKSYFPLLIDIKGKKKVIKRVEDLPSYTPFTVLETNYKYFPQIL